MYTSRQFFVLVPVGEKKDVHLRDEKIKRGMNMNTSCIFESIEGVK